MRNFVDSYLTRTLAFILAVVSAVTCVLSGIFMIVLMDYNAYDGESTIVESALEHTLHDKSAEVQQYYAEYLCKGEHSLSFEETEEFATWFSEKNSNYFFTVTDEKGEILVKSYDAKSQASRRDEWVIVSKYGEEEKTATATFATNGECEEYVKSFLSNRAYSVKSHMQDPVIGDDGVTVVGYTCTVNYSENEVMKIIVEGHIRTDLIADDSVRDAIRAREFLMSISTAVLYTCPLSGLLFIALTVLLCFGAGRKRGVDGICLSWIDRVPIDLVLLINAFLANLMIMAGYYAFENLYIYRGVNINGLLMLALGAAAVAGLAACLLWVITAIAARLKTEKWWRDTITFKLLRLTKRLIIKLFKVTKRLILIPIKGIKLLLVKLPLYWQAALVYFAVCFAEFVGMIWVFAYAPEEVLVFLWFVEKIILGVALMALVLLLRRLQKGAREISDGNLDYKVDTKYMPTALAEHAEQLNCIGVGLSKAVDERMRSERMKTELITNVSHDIKTPLTSIVNYVDLLKHEPIESEQAREYIEVLDRQSVRLKKLITDLVDASKASTGNMSTNMEPTDLKVLLSQTVGEYEENLRSNGLEPVVDMTALSSVVMADGRLLWRVFDNLLNNICKYAMKGTRVYIDLKVEGKKAKVAFKNISSSRLNVAGDELTERFVRGDASRNTEGSGLGLSIAKSLVDLQAGDFEIAVDGDLFKATVSFDIFSLS